MYPNFPKQVMDADEAELFFNAIMHYLGKMFGMNILPDYEEDERFPLTEFTKLKVINLGFEDDYHAIFTNLMSSSTSCSDEDRQNIANYITKYGEKSQFPESIPHKEMMAFVVATCKAHSIPLTCLTHIAKTALHCYRILFA